MVTIASPEITADPDRRRYRLLSDPRVLPTALSLRFAVLVLMIMAAAATVYGHLATLTAPDAATTAARCLGTAQPIPSALGDGPDTGGLQALLCLRQHTPLLAVWSVAGVVLVCLLALLLYALYPAWLSRSGWPRRPRRLHRLSAHEYPDIDAALAELAGRVGLSARERPTFLIHPDLDRADGRTFGWRRRSWIRLTAGLLLDPEGEVFRGAVLHELAHVHNRDNRATYLTLAVWRAFLVVVIVPYLVSLVVPGVFSGTMSWQAPDVRMLGSVGLLSAVVYLTKAAVFRARETYADAVAYQHDSDSVRATIRPRPGARVTRLAMLRNHFTPTQRLDTLGDPGALAGPDGLAMFGAGIAIALLAVDTVVLGWWNLLATTGTELVTRLILPVVLGNDAGDGFLLLLLLYGPVALLVAAIVAGLASVVAWREVLLTGGMRRVWRWAVPLVAGMVVGEPLSTVNTDAGTWGVFDTSGWLALRDVCVSALGLLLVVWVLFAWSADCAAAWAAGRSGAWRRLSTVAIILGSLAVAPFLSVWVAVHDNAAVGLLSVPTHVPPPVNTWPMAKALLALFSYDPLSMLVALPCGALCLAANLFPVLGRARRTSVVDRAVLWLGPTAAVVAVLLTTGLAFVFRDSTSADLLALVGATSGAAAFYVISGMVVVITLVSASGGAVAAWWTDRWSTGLFVAGAAAALAALAAPVDYVAAVCPPSGFVTCLTAISAPNVGILVGGVVQMAAVDTLIVTTLFLLLSRVFRRATPSRPSATEPSRRGLVVPSSIGGVALIALVAGSLCYSALFLHLW